ncbi:hypothetical protein B7P43_G05477 [Cryptotermes secundus]|uniref:Uncharacterized protein n=1 Tax=Cryptotermes secundus TaxID=105785 RepID=A0A2J7R1N8_9NEOP|nr:hypothetical protein B7P43_G05477 [Cryptotermes secundus]
MVKKDMTLELKYFKYHGVSTFFTEKEFDVERNEQLTSVNCEKLAIVINCDYGRPFSW